jgi:hypothetical protein
VAPVGHMGCPRVFIDVDLMTLDPFWGRRRLAASCVSQHAVGVRLMGGAIADVKEGRMTGAGEGIRTLDPDLGKVVLYP